MRLPLSLALAGLAGSLVAQNTMTVVPEGFAHMSGVTGSTQPFGSANPARALHVYGSAAIATPTIAVLNRIALRHFWISQVPGKGPVDLEIHASVTTQNPLQLDPTFANNHTGTLTPVFLRKPVQLPPATLTLPPLVPPFSIQFPFDVPFPYVRAGGNLAIEYRVHGQPAGVHELDVAGQTFNYHMNYGFDCSPMTMVVSGGTAGYPGTPLDWQVQSAPPGGFALLLLGLNPAPTPTRLPFSNNCWVYVDVLGSVSMPITGAGTVHFLLPVLHEHQGVRINSQVIALDAARTGLIGTRGFASTLGLAMPPVGTVSHEGSVTSPAGTTMTGAPVVELRS